jgi:hypothetical protein
VAKASSLGIAVAAYEWIAAIAFNYCGSLVYSGLFEK